MRRPVICSSLLSRKKAVGSEGRATGGRSVGRPRPTFCRRAQARYVTHDRWRRNETYGALE